MGERTRERSRIEQPIFQIFLIKIDCFLFLILSFFCPFLSLFHPLCLVLFDPLFIFNRAFETVKKSISQLKDSKFLKDRVLKKDFLYVNLVSLFISFLLSLFISFFLSLIPFFLIRFHYLTRFLFHDIITLPCFP